MSVDGFKTETEINAEKAHKKEQAVISHEGPTQRLKKVFRDAAETKLADVQQITDGILATTEGNEEIEQYKKEVLELVALESGRGGRINSGERLKIYHSHERRWKELEKKFANGELTPLPKEK